ncbi:MAG: RsmB/NOP family class I SAM-dependent RNA methyltransferase, partial [Alphaproteobacteria bacterium]|nr:RsmB/NOP family class I SAM-dependent RNA methyltransferase [Alphaproteobacteria bacterium]
SQRNILSLGATLVRPGGSLIYAVCSLIEAEGEAQCLAFLLENQDWTSAPLTADIGRIQGPGLILSPAHDGCDGFFVARLMRRNDDSI